MYRQFSRMGRLQEKRNIRKAAVFFLATLVIIALLATVGFSLLAKLFIFFGDIKSRTNPTVDKTDFIPPGPPQLALPVEATNSAAFALKGIAEPGATVYLSLNNAEVKSTQVPEGGIFEFSGINLELGENTFAAVAMDEAGNKSPVSTSVTVMYSNVPPKLELASPSDRQTFSGKDTRVTVKGKTDSGIRVTINDRIAIVSSDGSFQSQIGLNSGENVLVIVATDGAGNQARKELTLIYSQ
jgi:hypothetical protein